MGRGTSGKLYIGVNMELPGLPLNASIHAEQCLIANMVLHGEQGITEICTSHVPCGHCRQFMAEVVCAVRAFRAAGQHAMLSIRCNLTRALFWIRWGQHVQLAKISSSPCLGQVLVCLSAAINPALTVHMAAG